MEDPWQIVVSEVTEMDVCLQTSKDCDDCVVALPFAIVILPLVAPAGTITTMDPLVMGPTTVASVPLKKTRE